MNPLTARERREQQRLRAAVVVALRRVWPSLDPERLDETFPGWAAAVAAIVARGRRSSSAIAGLYVRQLRASAGVGGFPPLPGPRPLPVPVLESSLGVTGPVSIKKAMTRGVPLDRAVDAAFAASALAATRHVLDAGRETVLASAAADDRVVEWRRVRSPRACEFCDNLDDIYSTGDLDFKAHDGCACSVEPVYI